MAAGFIGPRSPTYSTMARMTLAPRKWQPRNQRVLQRSQAVLRGDGLRLTVSRPRHHRVPRRNLVQRGKRALDGLAGAPIAPTDPIRLDDREVLGNVSHELRGKVPALQMVVVAIETTGFGEPPHREIVRRAHGRDELKHAGDAEHHDEGIPQTA